MLDCEKKMKKLLILGITVALSACLISPTFASVVDPGTGAMDSLGSTESSTEEQEIATEAVDENTETDTGESEDGSLGGVGIETDNTHVLSGDELLPAPDVSIEDVDDYIADKGGDIIHIMQKGASYFVAIIAIGCFLLVLAGAVGNKKLLATGSVGLLICCVVYVGIFLGPSLLEWVRQWALPMY